MISVTISSFVEANIKFEQFLFFRGRRGGGGDGISLDEHCFSNIS